MCAVWRNSLIWLYLLVCFINKREIKKGSSRDDANQKEIARSSKSSFNLLRDIFDLFSFLLTCLRKQMMYCQRVAHNSLSKSVHGCHTNATKSHAIHCSSASINSWRISHLQSNWNQSFKPEEMASHIAQAFIAILAIVLFNSCFAQVIQKINVKEKNMCILCENSLTWTKLFYEKNYKSIFHSIQLTFSPNWGKRSGSNQLDIGNAASSNLNNNDNAIGDSAFRFGTIRNAPNVNGNNCKPSIDSVMLIYRMIQVITYILLTKICLIFCFLSKFEQKNRT